MYQLKILKTKKRLFNDEPLALVSIFIGLVGLLAIMTYAFKSVSMPLAYTQISAEIPVVTQRPVDPALHQFEETSIAKLSKVTPTVVLTVDAFYFGDLEAFSTRFVDIRRKFSIDHVDGEPQLGQLVHSLDMWAQEKLSATRGASLDEVVVFVPSGDIPMNVVIQVVDGLKQSQYFKRVVLGTGII